MLLIVDPTKRCDMGVGCDEAGVCFAEAHGEPWRCSLFLPPEMSWNEKGRTLYEDCQTVKPDWDDIGEVTKQVWIDEAKQGRLPEGWPPLNKKERS